MKKTYVKPIATNVEFAMNENIAASFGTAHLGYVNDLMVDDGSCNEYLADYGVPSGIVGEVKDVSDLFNALFRMHDLIGDEKYGEILADLRAGTFGCWKV